MKEFIEESSKTIGQKVVKSFMEDLESAGDVGDEESE